MLGRTITVTVAVVCGVVTSQVPEYTQQYRQRLGGAVDELRAVVQSFDADAERVGYTRPQAIAALARAEDPFPRERARSMQVTIDRYERLSRQQTEFRSAGPFQRIVVLAQDFDPTLAENAWEDFQPAVPTTAEGAVAAGVGAGFGVLLVGFLSLLFRRRRRRAPA
ncbi:DUF2937 family protein [Amorphus coralli]|uniref:DUF2937 family protein n=1 Tax=Amorphus coralli TaxID=340680 RepID=UPI00036E153B|nr:DUF2937 family protein [Amorphus coralli]